MELGEQQWDQNKKQAGAGVNENRETLRLGGITTSSCHFFCLFFYLYWFHVIFLLTLIFF